MEREITETQVAIIGAGIIGTAIARELSKYNVDICLLEKEPAIGFGITKGGQGLVHGPFSHFSLRISRWLQEGGVDLKDYLSQELNFKERLGDIGLKMYLELAPYLNVKIIQCGRVVVTDNQKEFEMLKIVKELAEAQGIGDFEILDKKGLEKKEPYIDTRFIGGLYDPTEASISPIEWATAFAENAMANGASVILNTEVKGIESRRDYYLIRTNNGTIKSEYIINAAGLFADEIASMIGKTDFSFTIFKCQMMLIDNEDYVNHVVCEIAKPQQRRMLIPTVDGKIFVSHSIDPASGKYDVSTTKKGLELISSYPQYFIPKSSGEEIITAFSGFIHYNSRSRDYVLEWQKGKFLNILVTAPGNGPSPALAQEIIKMLASGGLELTKKEDFNPYRFKGPRFIEIPTEDKNRKIRDNPKYGHIICRCENVTEQEVVEAIRAGARTLDEVKFRTGVGFGKCQGSFCTPRALKIMAQELGISPLELTKKGRNSYVLAGETKALRCA